jgi:hypothetical protein
MFAFFFFFLLSEGIGLFYYTKPMGGYHHFNCHSLQSPVSLLHCSSPLPHALFVLSSIFLAPKAKQWHCMLSLSPFPHILFTFYFQFILVFGCVVYDVFMRYFFKNLGFYFVMDLLKITRSDTTNPTKKPDPNRPMPAGFSHFYCYHGLEFIIPDWHGSGGRTGRNPPEPTRAQPYIFLLKWKKVSMDHSLSRKQEAEEKPLADNPIKRLSVSGAHPI